VSEQLANIVAQLPAGEDDLAVALALGQLIGTLQCSEPEKAILAALAQATHKPRPLYSAKLANACQGRELAAYGIVQMLRDVAQDTIDVESALAYALARELAGVLKILANDAIALLDGPLDAR
jgi:hypothetical protein